MVALAGLGARRRAARSAASTACANALEARHLVEAAAAVGRQRQAQDARRARVDGVDAAARGRTRSRRRSGCRGWSAGWRARASTCATLRLRPARARRRAAAVMSANERVRPPSSSRDANTGFGAEVAARHLRARPRPAAAAAARAGCRARSPAARAPNTARISASVSVPMYIWRRPVARQRALLVLAVGRLHRQRVGRQRGRQRLRHQQEARPRRRARSRRSGCSATARTRAASSPAAAARPRPAPRAGSTTRCARAWRSSCGGGRSGVRPAERAAGGDQRLAAAPPTSATSLAPRAARAGARAPAAAASARCSPSALGGQRASCCRGRSTMRIERAAAEVEAGVERAFDLDVEPALDAARDELVAHGVDQHARARTPTRAKIAASLSSSRLPNLPRAHAPEQAHARRRRSPAPAALASATLTQNSQHVVALVEARGCWWRCDSRKASTSAGAERRRRVETIQAQRAGAGHAARARRRAPRSASRGLS